ncbi:asparaginase [Sporolactobacillus shoreicorticis]|uniref:Asparaginase n=1 Tax=Sporolactobacillus shoreicorticis TaxID=1923877 RepID=A0ABW5S8F9_9BACL|nr:asparaginase [Sporolactobacillus shoreicorticis]MCO7126553.1 asparaginase [Sporolactobacillus shoreicorticis]
MKKILVLATGGTIVSTLQQNGLAPGLSLEQLSYYFKESHHSDAQISFQVLMNKDSTNMQPEDWLHIARTIYENRHQYDSFIITHGTDTMAYTAAGLSYLLSGIDKTIVITGSQVPISFRKTDAKKNIEDALTFAEHAELSGVYVVFDGKAILGTRAIKMRTKSYDAFNSINFPYIAAISQGRLDILYRPETETINFENKMNLCPNVFLVKAFPGLSPQFFDFIKKNAKGLIIESFGNGGLPFEKRNLVTYVYDLVHSGIPVVITTQCLEEGQNMSIYEVGKKVGEAGGITAGDMNTEAIVAKLMWILGTTNDLSEVKRRLQTPIAHDLNYI